MDVLAQVRATIDRHDLLARDGTVVVAVSGGPDSLCLLHVLCRLRGDYALRLHVAHLDHGLRPEAAADAEYVASLASAWGLPHTVGRADVRALARAQRRSLEEASRLARYRFLAQVAHEVGADRVAVGHNADDQVETALMHCLRGAGLAGLRGMRRRASWPQQAAGACPAPLLIRPLLDVPRPAVEAYCQEQGLQPRWDRTNVEMTFYRNRIRHELLPTLESYNPRIRRILHRSADALADDYACLQQALAALWPRLLLQQTAEAVVLRRPAFQELPPSPQRGALRRAVRSLRRSLRDIGWVHIEQARLAALEAPPGATITLPAGLVLEVGYDRLILRPVERPLAPPEAPAMEGPERRLQVPGCTPLDGRWAIEAALGAECPPPATAGEERLSLCLDADQAGHDLWLRTRRPGDRFQPSGMGGHHKSVKDYMIDARIPRRARDTIPLLVSEKGILWIVGYRAGEVALPGPQTRRFLHLQLVPPPEPAGPGPAGGQA